MKATKLDPARLDSLKHGSQKRFITWCAEKQVAQSFDGVRPCVCGGLVSDTFILVSRMVDG